MRQYPSSSSEGIKKFLKRIARHYGFVVQRYDPRNTSRRCSLKGSMEVARGAGFVPETIIDVGAARGAWSADVAAIWPDARYVLIDPLEENHQELQSICGKLKNADYRIAAITDHSGKIIINVHPDLEGSSIFLEREDNINGIPRDVVSITLDDLIVELRIENPILLKADVQGAEMQVLLSAEKSLPLIEMVVLEVLLFDIYQGRSVQLYDMIHYMKLNGFVTWDIFGMGYRMLDDALSQIDVVFVRDDGMFRKAHGYATEAQRVAQLASIQTGSPKRFKQI